MIGLTDALKAEHKEAKNCHICLKEFNDPQNRKVRDHCHYTGLYRGAAHNNCNLKYWIPDHTLILLHNLSGYDLKNYKLDPAHFYTAPGLAWQALLKTAAAYCEHEKKRKGCELCLDKFKLELLTDIDMLLMVDKVFKVGLLRRLNVMPRLIISI